MVALKASMPNLIHQTGTGIFALGYWPGCRVSDVLWITVENCHIGPKADRVTEVVKVVSTDLRQRTT